MLNIKAFQNILISVTIIRNSEMLLCILGKDNSARLGIQNGLLFNRSPCIDNGDPTISDTDSSQSDMGCYGGPMEIGNTYNILI